MHNSHINEGFQFGPFKAMLGYGLFEKAKSNFYFWNKIQNRMEFRVMVKSNNSKTIKSACGFYGTENSTASKLIRKHRTLIEFHQKSHQNQLYNI